MAADETVVTPPAGAAARDQRLGGDAAAVELFAHPGHKVVQMELDAGELGLVGAFLFLVGAGYTAPEAEGQIPPRLLGVHGVEDLLLVPDEAVQLVFHAPGGLAPGGRLGGRVGQQVQHARRFCPGESSVGVPGQAEQVEQHLTVEAAVDFPQVELFRAGLIVHHPHPAGAVVLDPLVGAVHGADELHRPAIREAVGLTPHGVLAGADLQLTGHRFEAGLALLIPQVAKQARHALFEAGEQIGEAGRVLGEIALCVLIYEKPGQRRHGLVIEVEEGL